MTGRIHPRRGWLAAILTGALVTTGLGVVSTVGAAAEPGSSNLGLPSLREAASYNLEPASRTVLPTGVSEAWSTNSDYLTAASSVSETDGHDLQTGQGSSTANTDGVTVRQAGPQMPGAWFSYQLTATTADMESERQCTNIRAWFPVRQPRSNPIWCCCSSPARTPPASAAYAWNGCSWSPNPVSSA